MRVTAHGLLTIAFLTLLTNILAQVPNNDTGKKKKMVTVYRAPDSSMFYHGSWYGFMKQTLIIGEIELQDSCFTFKPIHGIVGWPDEVFKRLYPFNGGFRSVSIVYGDVKRIRYTGRIKLKNGAVHQMFGIRRRYWIPIFRQIKARVKTAV